MSPRPKSEAEPLPPPADGMLPFPSDEELCAKVGRACLALLGTSTSLAGLFDALPRLLADGLGLAGVAIRLDPEPVRPLAVHDDDDPFSSAIRNAPPAGKQTRETLKEDARWAQRQIER